MFMNTCGEQSHSRHTCIAASFSISSSYTIKPPAWESCTSLLTSHLFLYLLIESLKSELWAWHSVIHFVLLAPGHLLHYLCCQVFHCVSCHLCCCYSPNLWRLQRPERWWELEQWLDYTNLVTDVTCRDVSFVMVWHVSWHSQTLETSDQGQRDVYEAIQAVGPHSDVRVIAGLYLETEQGAFHPAELLWL